MAPLVDLSRVIIDEDKPKTLKWVDDTQKKPLAEESPDDEDLVNKVNRAPTTLNR